MSLPQENNKTIFFFVFSPRPRPIQQLPVLLAYAKDCYKQSQFFGSFLEKHVKSIVVFTVQCGERVVQFLTGMSTE